ncbi:hypothetical protein [Aeromicrobium sp. CnD17-E]|uniref:hypothetical protein n=1 Tax=Aeromicrobium sp. CnD17-E TaxID=2954487 RepID=UPI0020983BDF|nr:hypothetical protein [Aeromicrobium sp. CnD17-E]MCO7239489.1 hypothetical protein [Aeromicrobium sp. CnD17-E]
MELQIMEARVTAVAEAVLAGRQVEDDRVELKAQWPPADHDVARRIAGHANAAGGESILWVVGLDEKGRRYANTSAVEPADWWSAVQKHFDGPAPEPKWLRVPVSATAEVVAVQFTTERAPYVVKVKGPGKVHREVPWRTSTSIRSAFRHEMIRSLVGEAAVPGLELIGGTIDVERFADTHGMYDDRYGYEDGTLRVRTALDIFLSARAPVHMPQHRQSLTIRTNVGGTVDLGTFAMTGSYRLEGSSAAGRARRVPDGGVLILGRSTVAVSGPGELFLRGSHVLQPGQGDALLRALKMNVDLNMPIDSSARTSHLSSRMSVAHLEFDERDIPDQYDDWHLARRFAVGQPPAWRA